MNLERELGMESDSKGNLFAIERLETKKILMSAVIKRILFLGVIASVALLGFYFYRSQQKESNPYLYKIPEKKIERHYLQEQKGVAEGLDNILYS